MGSERRKHQRLSIEVTAVIETSGIDKKVLELMTIDISAGGAFLRTTEPLPKGTPISIQIILPLDKIKALKDTDHAMISLSGSVIRSGEEGMSVRFDDRCEIIAC